MGTNPDPAFSPAPEPEDSPRGGRFPPVSAVSLAWAIPVAIVAPWRAFPVILRVSISPLLAAYLASIAGSLTLTFYSLSRAGWPTGRWQGVLFGQTTNMAAGLLGLYVLLTLSGASRRQRLAETLTVGLKLALAAKASMFLYTAAIYVTMRMAGLGPGRITAAAYLVLIPCLVLYVTAAMCLAAARLADRDDQAERDDPLWPRCIACDYSLRGLPAAEAWLARRQGQASVPPLVAGESPACPECGSLIEESLRTWDAWLDRGRRQPGTGVSLARSDAWDAGVLTPWFDRLLQWMADGRRTTAVGLWLVLTAILAVAIAAGPSLMSSRPFSLAARISLDLWKEVLFWTGGTGLLAGLRFWLRSRHNVIWLSQHVLVPATCAAGVILVMLLGRYRHLTGVVISNQIGLHAIFLPLVPFVLIVEYLVLWRIVRTWPTAARR